MLAYSHIIYLLQMQKSEKRKNLTQSAMLFYLPSKIWYGVSEFFMECEVLCEKTHGVPALQMHCIITYSISAWKYPHSSSLLNFSCLSIDLQEVLCLAYEKQKTSCGWSLYVQDHLEWQERFTTGISSSWISSYHIVHQDLERVKYKEIRETP